MGSRCYLPTIKDVAKRAGVAQATVSRVINSSSHVSEGARKRVHEAIEALSYVPNSVARSLRVQHTRTVALIVADMTLPFWTAVATGVEEVVAAEGFSLIVMNAAESEEREQACVSVALAKRVDGVLLTPISGDSQSAHLVHERGVPLVLLDRRLDGLNVDVVRGDSVGGSLRLMEHLLQLGHRRIALITGSMQVSTAYDRFQAYRQALQQVGIPVRPEWEWIGHYSRDSGYRAVLSMFSGSDSPTAVLAASCSLAVGAMQAFNELGIRVPADVSLVTFDDMPEYTVQPFFTVCRQPAREMGKQGALRLLARARGEGDALPVDLVLPVEISLQRSSGPAF